MERSTIFYGKIHYKWPFLIAMLAYQRVHWYPGWYQWYPSNTSEVHWQLISVKNNFSERNSLVRWSVYSDIQDDVQNDSNVTQVNHWGYYGIFHLFFKWEMPSTGDICHHIHHMNHLCHWMKTIQNFGVAVLAAEVQHRQSWENVGNPMPETRPIIWG